MSGRLPAAPMLEAGSAPAPGQGGDIRLALTAGQPLEALADRVGALAERFNRSSDADAAQRAFEEGQLAGNAEPGAQASGGRLFRSAFERGATEASARRLEISARQRYDELAREHATDPAAFSAAAAAYRDGIMRGLPASVRAAAAPQLDAVAIPYLRQIGAQQERQVAEERLATFNEANTQRLAAVERLALAASRDPRLTQQLDGERAGFVSDLVAMGPRGAFSFRGVQYPPDPTRAGALSVTEMARAAQRLDDTERESIAIGAFRSGPRSESWIREFERREMDPAARSGLRPDQVERVAGRMRAEAARDRQLAREARADARDTVLPQIEARTLAIRATGSADALPPLPERVLRTAGLDPAQVAATERNEQAFFTARQQVNEPDGRAALTARVSPGGDLFAADPRRAVQVLEQLRGADMRAEDLRLTGVIADRAAEQMTRLEQASAGGERPAFAPVVSAAEAVAAGRTPQWADQVNAQQRQAFRVAELSLEARGATPERLAAIRAELDGMGPGAAGEREALGRFQAVLTSRDRAVREDPAAYVASLRPRLVELQQAALTGDAAALGAYVRASLNAQAEIGVPEPLRQALPKPMASAVLGSITDAPNPDAALGALLRVQQALGPEGTQRLLDQMDLSGNGQGTREAAIRVAAARLATDPALARDLLRGAYALRDAPMPQMTAALTGTAADTHIGDSLPAPVRAAALEAARALYADRQLRAGKAAAAFDRGVFTEALQRVVPMADVNGFRTPLPPGVPAAQFRRLIDAMPAEAMAGARAADGRPFTAEMLARGTARLVAVGPGQYRLQWNGFDVLDANRPGQAFVLDLLNREAVAMPAGPDRLANPRRFGDRGSLGNFPPVAEPEP